METANWHQNSPLMASISFFNLECLQYPHSHLNYAYVPLVQCPSEWETISYTRMCEHIMFDSCLSDSTKPHLQRELENRGSFSIDKMQINEDKL